MHISSFIHDQETRRQEFQKKVGGRKVDYEYQELALEIAEAFSIKPKQIIWVFSREWGTVPNIRRAFKVCKEMGILKLPYLIAVANPKPKLN